MEKEADFFERFLAARIDLCGVKVKRSSLAGAVWQGVLKMADEATDSETPDSRRGFLLERIRESVFVHYILMGECSDTADQKADDYIGSLSTRQSTAQDKAEILAPFVCGEVDGGGKYFLDKGVYINSDGAEEYAPFQIGSFERYRRALQQTLFKGILSLADEALSSTGDDKDKALSYMSDGLTCCLMLCGLDSKTASKTAGSVFKAFFVRVSDGC